MIITLTEDNYEFLRREWEFNEGHDPRELVTRRIKALAELVYKIGLVEHNWRSAEILLKPLIKTCIFNEQYRHITDREWDRSTAYPELLLEIFSELECLILCSNDLMWAIILQSKQPSDKLPIKLPIELNRGHTKLNELESIDAFEYIAEEVFLRIHSEPRSALNDLAEAHKIKFLNKMRKTASLRGFYYFEEASS